MSTRSEIERHAFSYQCLLLGPNPCLDIVPNHRRKSIVATLGAESKSMMKSPIDLRDLTIAELSKLVAGVAQENQKLKEENKKLKKRIERL